MRSSSVQPDTLLARRVWYLSVCSALIPVLVAVATCLIVSERGRAVHEHAISSVVEDMVELTRVQGQSELQTIEE